MTDQEAVVQFAEFMTETPPGIEKKIIAHTEIRSMRESRVLAPGLQLYCSACKAEQYFHPDTLSDDILVSNWSDSHDDDDDDRTKTSYVCLHYSCVTCEGKKVFFLQVRQEAKVISTLKIGEHPSHIPRVADRLRKFLGSEGDNYFKGRRCETQGFGIAAFAYYRRVVEARKEQLFALINTTAEALKIEPEKLAKLRQAATEVQFTKALEQAKDAIPERLFIADQNPFILLYQMLSVGIHELSDEECLTHAHAVRTVLARLIELTGEVAKEDTEVRRRLAQMVRPKK